MKKVGILGSGIVGKTLGSGFIKYGYEVKIGTRNPKNVEAWLEHNKERGSAGTFQDAAEFGKLIVLAVRGSAAKHVISSIPQVSLMNKTIIDATNPLEEKQPDDGVLSYYTDINYSLMEELQDIQQGAHFVKAFNCIGAQFMVNPEFESKPSMFIAGNSEKAKDEVSDILKLFGFDVEDMGSAKGARAIEPLCMLYCIPGFREHSWNHAFKLLKK